MDIRTGPESSDNEVYMKQKSFSFKQKQAFHSDRVNKSFYRVGDELFRKPNGYTNKVRYSEGFLMGANGASYDKYRMWDRSVRLGWLRGLSARKKFIGSKK